MKDSKGTLYLAPDGTVYQLDDYLTDWAALEGSEGETPRKPYYSVMLNRATSGRSGFSRADELPEGAVVIWSPPREV